MTGTVTIDRAPVARAKPASVERRGKATVSASELARHLDCSRAYLHKLEADGVIQRRGDGFPLDQSRIAYLRYLRRDRKQSPRSQADAEFASAKAELIRLRIAERQGQLVSLEAMTELIDLICGIVNTHMYAMSARIGGRDLALRRKIDSEVRATMTEIAGVAERKALEIEVEIERMEKADADGG